MDDVTYLSLQKLPQLNAVEDLTLILIEKLQRYFYFPFTI